MEVQDGKYGFKRKYEGFHERFFHEGLHVQLAEKLFYLKTFMAYSSYVLKHSTNFSLATTLLSSYVCSRHTSEIKGTQASYTVKDALHVHIEIFAVVLMNIALRQLYYM